MPKGQVRGRFEDGDSPLIRPSASFSAHWGEESSCFFQFLNSPPMNGCNPAHGIHFGEEIIHWKPCIIDNDD